MDRRDRGDVNPSADCARGSGKPAAPLLCSRIDGVDGPPHPTRDLGIDAPIFSIGFGMGRRDSRWSAIRAAYPDASRSEIVKLCRADYLWLFHYDGQWLEEHQLPNKPSPSPCVGQPGSKLLTSENDRTLAEKVAAAGEQLRILPGHPKRVTLTQLCAHVPGLKSACRKLTSLPYTAAAVETSVESYEQCALRRIAFVVAKYSGPGSCLTLAQLTFLADVNRPSFSSQH